MKQVEVYQALWAMEDYPSVENTLSLTEGLFKIQDSGFDGVLQYIDDFEASTISDTRQINNSPLKLALSCRGFNIEDIEKKLKYAAEHKAEFINVLVIGYFIRGQEALDYIRAIQKLGDQLGVKTYIETHRGTITQDLNCTLDYIEAIGDLRLTIDLSHYVLAGEIDETYDLVEESFDRLLQRTASIHVRVSNGQQIQLSMDTIIDEQLNNYKRWWTNGLNYASKTTDSETIPVVIELGPFPYQLKVKDNFDYDRYEEAVRWMEYFRTL